MKNSFLKGLFLSMLFTGIFLSSCEKQEFKGKPAVVTGEVSAITSKSATVKGTIVELGGGITDYGHCWSTDQQPSITNEKTSLGKTTALNDFTSELVNLEPGVMYYVRNIRQNAGVISPMTAEQPSLPGESAGVQAQIQL